MSVDLYDTLKLLWVEQGLVPEPSFLTDRYAPTGPGDVFASEMVAIERRDAERRAAAFVLNGSTGQVVSRNGQDITLYTPPMVKPKRTLSQDDLSKKGLGEAIFPDSTPAERAIQLAARDLLELDTMCARTEAAMVSEVLFTNEVTVREIDDDGELVREDHIKFYEGENLAKADTDTDWNDPDAHIVDDIDGMVEKLEQNGLPAVDLLMASDVARAVMKNAEIQKELDIRNYNVGRIEPMQLGPGAAHLGTLNVFGVDINLVTYRNTYVDPIEKKLKPFIPQGHAALTAPGSLARLYGAVTQIDPDTRQHVTYPNPRVPKVLVNEENETRSIQLTSRPIVIPHSLNCSIAIQAIGGE